MALPEPIPLNSTAKTVVPRRAIVTPRAWRLPDGDALPIEQLVRPFLSRNVCGVIHLRGLPGSGVSTALSHLAAVLPREANVSLLDVQHLFTLETASRRGLVIAAGGSCNHRTLAEMEMVGWSDDDLIEYLLAAHHDRCSSVIARVRADPERGALRGSPELWSIVLEAIAANPSIQYVASAMRSHLHAVIPAACRRIVGHECLRQLSACDPAFRVAVPDLPAPFSCLFRHRCVRVALAAEYVVETLCEGRDNGPFQEFPSDLLNECALLVRSRPAAIERLAFLVRSRDGRGHSVAASILLAADPRWRPSGAGALFLSHAQLSQASWSGARLPCVDFDRATLQDAELSDAILDHCTAEHADFSGASLRHASIDQARFRHAQLINADLSGVAGDHVEFELAALDGARLDRTVLRRAKLHGATLRRASFIQAYLREADFRDATLDHTNLSGADLAQAKLDGCDLRSCNLEGTSFAGASLVACSLEGVTLAGPLFADANLNEALLSGSFILGGRFRGASFRQAGLADINWEAADLRDADFCGASFHLGSTRSGLVGSTVASEGTRTGFYTDDYDDRESRPPEEIRQANLRGADLRGAQVEETDWYLVDLRDAKYTPDQEEHFRRCGAIL